MAIKYEDRVREFSETTGTGTITLDGAAVGYRPFSVLDNGDEVTYLIEDNGEWEIGIGTYNDNTLSRDTLTNSSTGSFLNLTSTLKPVSLIFDAYTIRRIDEHLYGHTDSTSDVHGVPVGESIFHTGDKASESVATGGTDNDTLMTPLRVLESINANAPEARDDVLVDDDLASNGGNIAQTNFANVFNFDQSIQKPNPKISFNNTVVSNFNQELMSYSGGLELVVTNASNERIRSHTRFLNEGGILVGDNNNLNDQGIGSINAESMYVDNGRVLHIEEFPYDLPSAPHPSPDIDANFINYAGTHGVVLNEPMRIGLASSTEDDISTIQILRHADYSGGQGGNVVNNAISAVTYVGPNAASFEWTALFQLFMDENNTETPMENLAMYAQAHKTQPIQGVWGGCFEIRDNSINPTAGTVGIEITDLANGTDNNNVRRALYIVAADNQENNDMAYRRSAIHIETQDNSTYKRGLELTGNIDYPIFMREYDVEANNVGIMMPYGTVLSWVTNSRNYNNNNLGETKMAMEINPLTGMWPEEIYLSFENLMQGAAIGSGAGDISDDSIRVRVNGKRYRIALWNGWDDSDPG